MKHNINNIFFSSFSSITYIEQITMPNFALNHAWLKNGNNGYMDTSKTITSCHILKYTFQKKILLTKIETTNE